MGEEDLCVRVMGETLVMKRRRLLESVLLARGRLPGVLVLATLMEVSKFLGGSLKVLLDPTDEREPISFSGCACESATGGWFSEPAVTFIMARKRSRAASTATSRWLR